MKNIEYFKLQAKNLYRDYKTQYSYVDEIDGNTYFAYKPKYFDIESLFLDWYQDSIIEEKFTLMKAQHLIAKLLGFNKWDELISASEEQLRFLHLLFDNEHHANLEEWNIYLKSCYKMNPTISEFSYSEQQEIFEEIFIKQNLCSDFVPYRLDCQKKREEMNPSGEFVSISRY